MIHGRAGSRVSRSAGVILVYFLCHVFTRAFDPFAPVWLFLLGYAQVYVIQALSYHDWALEIRGRDLVTAANLRAVWAIVWFLAVYQLGAGRALAPGPAAASAALVADAWPPCWPSPGRLGPLLPGVMIKGGIQAAEATSAEESLLRSFPFVMMVAAVMLIVTGRTPGRIAALVRRFGPGGGRGLRRDLDVQRQAFARVDRRAARRSARFYISRRKRPSWPVLLATLCAGALVVGIAIGWRNNAEL